MNYKVRRILDVYERFTIYYIVLDSVSVGIPNIESIIYEGVVCECVVGRIIQVDTVELVRVNDITPQRVVVRIL